MAEDHELVAAFLRGANVDTASAAITAALVSALARARAARPAIVAAIDDFGAAIGAAVGQQPDAADAIAALHAADLWLATACASEHRVAIAELERVLASLRPTLARMGASAETIDELLQEHRARLLSSAPDRPARIRGYRGTGDLRSWLKVALVRDAVRALRKVDRATNEDDEIDRLMDPGGDIELQAMQDSYRLRFRAAFAETIAALPPRERNVLRYHVLEGLAIDDIGAIYRVHRATAARWLVRIRETLYDGTRRELMRSLSLTPSELDSVLRMIRSRLDASIANGLAEPTPSGGAPARE